MYVCRCVHVQFVCMCAQCVSVYENCALLAVPMKHCIVQNPQRTVLSLSRAQAQDLISS